MSNSGSFDAALQRSVKQLVALELGRQHRHDQAVRSSAPKRKKKVAKKSYAKAVTRRKTKKGKKKATARKGNSGLKRAAADWKKIPVYQRQHMSWTDFAADYMRR